MKFKTKISKTIEGKHYLKNKCLEELIENYSFLDLFFLLLRNDLPQEKEKKFLESILIASVEHGISTPSIFVPRIVASVGNPFNTALAASILSTGNNHGGAIEKLSYILKSGKSAAEIVRELDVIPGFGHQVYKQEDPRAKAIFKKAKELGFAGKYFELVFEIEKELEKKKGKKIPLNIDGAIAAGILELGFSPEISNFFFVFPRLLGATAHILEEFEQGNKYYRLQETDIEYED